MSARSHKYPNPILPRDGEITLKEYLNRKGAQRGITGHGFYHRLDRGLEPWPAIRRVNARVIYVTPEHQHESRIRRAK